MQRDVALITAAINRKQTLEIEYEPGWRVIEPHALGRSADGHLLLRAYQVKGASASGEHAHWKLFRVDRLRGVESDGGSFSGPREGYRRGDRAMKGGIIAEL
jgi:predicted DNA-binding transcriptional regulator YafY